MLTIPRTNREVVDEINRVGEERFFSITADLMARGKTTLTPAGSFLLSEAVTPMETAYKAWMEAETKKNHAGRPGAYQVCLDALGTLRPIVVAAVTARTILDVIWRTDLSYTSVALQLADYLEGEVAMVAVRKQAEAKTLHIHHSKSRKMTSAKAKSKALVAIAAGLMKREKWSQSLRVQIGMLMIDLFESSTGLIQTRLQKAQKGRKTTRLIEPTEATVKWFEQAQEAKTGVSTYAMLRPLPEPPNDWSNLKDGGYPVNGLLNTSLIHASGEKIRHQSRAKLPREVIKAVNALQRTPWRVNQFVLETMMHLWDHDEIDCGELFEFRHDTPIPEKPHDISTNAVARKQWAQATGAILRGNRVKAGHRLRFLSLLGTAREQAALDRFYFPYYADFRGRLYPAVSPFNPQGVAEMKGLLEFAEGRQVKRGTRGEYWLLVHAANSFGEDKISLNDRAAWAEAHAAQIIACSKDPIANRYWFDAEQPWQFLAVCFELDQLWSEGQVDSHCPVYIDGSNNGLQLFSLALRDEVGARSTNCAAAGPEELPHDAYQDVADKATAKIKAIAADETEGAAENRRLAKVLLRLVGGRLGRKAAKRPVMTMPYGVTRYSVATYTQEYLLTFPEGKTLMGQDFLKVNMLLSGAIWEAIEETIIAAAAAMKWLQAASEVLSEAKQPTIWQSPSGLLVASDYRVPRYRRVRLATGVQVAVKKRSTSVTLMEPTTKIDKTAARQAVAANWVHSLDAAVLAKTAIAARDAGIESLATVHDSYGAHADRVDQVGALIRESVVSIFSVDVLEDLRTQWQALLPAGVELPPTPPRGSLNIEDVRNATYFFA